MASRRRKLPSRPLDALPTDSFHIRLLKLHPKRASSADDEIKASLYKFPLQSVPEFEALSYTWALAGNEQSIVVNRSELPIRNNLHQFLRKLRLTDSPRLTWVDAICAKVSKICPELTLLSAEGEAALSSPPAHPTSRLP